MILSKNFNRKYSNINYIYIIMNRNIFLLFLVLIFFIPFIFKKRISENFDNPGTYVPPPLPERCKTSDECVFENGQRLEGCPGGLTDKYVCRLYKTLEQRKQRYPNNPSAWTTSDSCPFQCFEEGSNKCRGNWRWIPQVIEGTKEVKSCIPPVNGSHGYEQPDIKMGPKYYLSDGQEINNNPEPSITQATSTPSITQATSTPSITQATSTPQNKYPLTPELSNNSNINSSIFGSNLTPQNIL